MKRAITVGIFALSLMGCSEDDGEEPASSPSFGTDSDIAMAEAIWTEIDGYSNWDRLSGATGFIPGGSPHGDFHRIYQNDVAGADPAALAEGSILVKENFGAESEDALGPITIMKRIQGYSPDDGDWFYAKYLPDGSLDMNADGVKLAGAIGKGGEQGCVPCHAGAAGSDYVFEN